MRRAVVRLALVALTGVGCGLGPEPVSFRDPRVVKLMAAMKVVDRASLGFTPIDMEAKLRLEWRPRAGYDAMLHVEGKTHRTIAFRRRADRYEWIGEQEVFEGPGEYDSPDGRFHERIVLTFETEPVSGAPLGKISIDYVGNDPRLATRRDLSLADVKPVLVAWGYT